MTTFRAATWPQIETLREETTANAARAQSLQQAAQLFAEKLAGTFTTCALVRVFALAPLDRLPRSEQTWAREFAASAGRSTSVEAKTPVLTLLGTAGRSPSWNDRLSSAGHRAIPLVDQSFVDGAPMISGLLHSLRLDTKSTGTGGLQIRAMPGGINARFYVEDALTSKDTLDRHIIASRDFVVNHKIKSVFGLGGSYVNGIYAIAIVFTTETLTPLDVDRFSTFISTFKMATSDCVQRGHLFAAQV